MKGRLWFGEITCAQVEGNTVLLNLRYYRWAVPVLWIIGALTILRDVAARRLVGPCAQPPIGSTTPDTPAEAEAPQGLDSV